MDKETLLQNYIDIETKTFIRTEKNKRLDYFIESLKSSNYNLTLSEIISLTRDLLSRDITIRHPFFLNIIYPVVFKGVDNQNLDAVKLLIKIYEYFGNYENLTSDNKYSRWTLLELGLKIAPDDIELLEQFERRTKDFLKYTLHELPAGVLYGSNGATIEECDELIKELAEYELICDKLQRDENELIKECSYYYSAYKNYLLVYQTYQGFADYLDKQIERPK